MGMLERIKKRQLEGFKEFVINLETTSGLTRSQIFTAGALEDPIFMGHVIKNLRTFDDFLKLDPADIEVVLTSQEQLINLFAKCVHGPGTLQISDLEPVIPRLVPKLKDELSYLQEVSSVEKDGARSHILKLTRKLQIEDKIHGFRWMLPPLDIFYPKILKDGAIKLEFESGMVAAEGQAFRGKRIGNWKHYYEGAKIMATGGYVDGFKSGMWTFYYMNGNKKSEGNYLDDLKHGPWTEWSRDNLLSKVYYKEGVKVESEFY